MGGAGEAAGISKRAGATEGREVRAGAEQTGSAAARRAVQKGGSGNCVGKRGCGEVTGESGARSRGKGWGYVGSAAASAGQRRGWPQVGGCIGGWHRVPRCRQRWQWSAAPGICWGSVGDLLRVCGVGGWVGWVGGWVGVWGGGGGGGRTGRHRGSAEKPEACISGG